MLTFREILMSENVREFYTIAGLIFSQLYKALPVPENIDTAGIAEAMGVAGGDWSKHNLPSGRSFNEMLQCTIGWLNDQDYIKAFGAHASQNAMLTTRGLAAMSAVPFEQKEPLGTALRKAVEEGSAPKRDLNRIGDLMGGFFGGLIKSISSG
jgi:hypothetical protein